MFFLITQWLGLAGIVDEDECEDGDEHEDLGCKDEDEDQYEHEYEDADGGQDEDEDEDSSLDGDGYYFRLLEDVEWESHRAYRGWNKVGPAEVSGVLVQVRRVSNT
jgi:hypothetical protein